MSDTLGMIQSCIEAQINNDYAGRGPEVMKDLMCLGLVEEAGEVAGLRKRELRCNSRDIEKVQHIKELYKEELGDVLWYLCAVCIAQGLTLDEVWEYNQKKLERRYGNARQS